MKVPISVILLCILASAQNHEAKTIKGHALGETLREFLAAANKPNAIERCQMFVSQRHPKDFIFGPKDRDPSFEMKRCHGVLSASQGARSVFHMPGIGYVQFNHGIFVGAKIEVVNSLATFDQQVSYLAILEDAIRKYGQPTEDGSTAWQNGFGATIHPRYANWTRPDVVVNLREASQFKGSGYQPDIDLIVMLRSEAESMQEDEAKSESSRQSLLDSK